MTQSNTNPYPNYGFQNAPYAPYGNMNQAPQQQQQQQQQQQAFQQALPYQTAQPQPGIPIPFPQNTATATPGMLPLEASYIENILRLNRGKLATIYATFENNTEWNAKVFKGIIEAAGRDHVIISDPQTGMRYLIPMVYLDYVTFDEEIEYDYPFNGPPSLATYSTR